MIEERGYWEADFPEPTWAWLSPNVNQPKEATRGMV
jgi:hypothetical protein